MKQLLTIAVVAILGYVGWNTFINTSADSVATPVVTLEGEEYATASERIASYFTDEALVGDVSIVECTLSGGTQTECYQFTVTSQPKSETVGPWCPTNIDQLGEDAGGMWLEGGEVYEVDGEFIAGLAEFYDDENWQLYDESTGEINITDTQLACEAAARPDVAEEYQNHCVECQLSYFEASEQTYVIPVDPVMSDEPVPTNGQAGVAISFTGVRFDGPAPVAAILGAHTIAAFDDCGGHVNPAVGYHYHAATDCPEQIDTDGVHAPIIGLALDGHTLHTQDNADGTSPTDLDECNGHVTEGVGYHYHAGAEGSNQILGCYNAESGCVLTDAGQSCDASVTTGRGARPANGERPDGPPPERE